MKKFLCSLAILATVFGMTTSIVMAKTFTDVKDPKYKEAVDILSDLKIINGYEDNTYKPTNSVKRSEMAKLIIVAVGKESSAQLLAGKTDFNDVGAGHWASGYINLASSYGWIKGYPDGTFRPDATVSYVEAATMLLRALNYGTELNDLSWPTGYMTKANSVGILKNVTSSDSSAAAIRGNVASMILNTLKADTRKVISSNSTGNVYGNGDILIEKSFSKFVYVEKGVVTNINPTEKILTVKDEEKNRTVYISYTDENTIKTMFGSEVSFIYDEKNEKLFDFEILDDLTVEIVNVKAIDEDAWILIDDKDNEYDMPKSSNILFLGTQKYTDIKKAYIAMDSKNKVTHLTLEGEEKIYIGVVTNDSIKVNNVDGIEIKNIKGEREEVILAKSSLEAYDGEVILFTYDNDNKIVIKSVEYIDESLDIESVAKDSIKLYGKTKLTFSEASSYKLYLIEGSYIEEGTLSDVNKVYDTAITLKLNDKYFIIVFMNSITEEEVQTASHSAAKKVLKAAIDAANKKKEASYSVKTYEKLRDALSYGNRIYSSASSYSAGMLELAAKEINEAVANLKAATSSDKDLRSAYTILQNKIKEAEALKAYESNYTADSFKKLTDTITAAKAIAIDNTTTDKISTATNNLKNAITFLVTNAANKEITDARAALKAAITTADDMIRANTYTSYANLKVALSAAKGIVDSQNTNAKELNNVLSNLEAEIKALPLGVYKTAREALDANMVTAISRWEDFAVLYPTIKTNYDGLKTVAQVERLSITLIKEETTTVKNLNDDITEALAELAEKTDSTLRNNSINTIKKYVQEVTTKYQTEDAWNAVGEISWAALQSKITKANKVLEDLEDPVEARKYSTADLKEIADDLELFIPMV